MAKAGPVYYNDASGNVTIAGALVQTPGNYGELYLYENATVITLTEMSKYYLVHLGATGLCSGVVYKAGKTAAISAFADLGSNVIQATVAAGHTLVDGDCVTVAGTSAPNDYNGTYVVSGVDATHFSFTKAGFNATTTGVFHLGASLTPAVSGIYVVQFHASVRGSAANKHAHMEVFKNATEVNNVSGTIKLANATDEGMIATTGLVSVTAGDHLYVAVECTDAAEDIVLEMLNFNVRKL